MRLASVGILELGEVDLGEELLLREFGLELFPFCHSTAGFFVCVLPAGPLVEPFGFPVTAVASGRQDPARKLLHADMEGMICEEISCVDLVLAVRKSRYTRNNFLGTPGRDDGQLHLDEYVLHLLRRAFPGRVDRGGCLASIHNLEVGGRHKQ